MMAVACRSSTCIHLRSELNERRKGFLSTSTTSLCCFVFDFKIDHFHQVGQSPYKAHYEAAIPAMQALQLE